MNRWQGPINPPLAARLALALVLALGFSLVGLVFTVGYGKRNYGDPADVMPFFFLHLEIWVSPEGHRVFIVFPRHMNILAITDSIVRLYRWGDTCG